MIRILLVFLLLLPSGAMADKVALVIGNAAYDSVAVLDNPANDSRDVSRALARQGFDVIAANDLNRVRMRDTLREFRELADRAEVALVYYAGHGIEIAGRNYLVPVDARLEDERDAELEMIDLDLVLAQISGAKALKMVVLDACRNNPFVVKMKRAEAGRSVKAGLGRIEFAQADTLIAYAAAAGEITPDGASGGNSPFTRAFLSALEGPPTDVRRLLGRVRDQMRQDVPDAAPFVYTSLGGGEFVINPNSKGASQPVAQAAGPSISEDFISTDRAGDFDAWNGFLLRHEGQSDHPLYAFALEKRESLRGARVALATPEAAGPNPERPAARAEPEPTPTPDPQAIARAVPVPDDEVARQLQVLLRDAGCYRGAIDGILGRGSRGALARFAAAAGIDLPSQATVGGAPLQETLAQVQDNVGVECPQVAAVRRTPQPRVSTKPATAPVSAAPTPQPQTLPQDSREPRRTKLLPEKGSEQIECKGPRRKFYDCP
ncbi:caspase family protein [Arenibacterium halophilum]|nr:caspase family protein [Arenibacterium halophilum]